MNSIIPTNADMTIYNKYHLDRTTEAWHRTYIKNVSWIASRSGASAGSNGLNREREIKIRIPVSSDTNGREYVDRSSFLGESGSLASQSTWTIKEGDYIVRGYSESAAPPNGAYEVLDYADNRDVRIPKYMRHWRIAAK